MGAAGNHSRNHDVFERREFGEELVELKDESDVPVAEVGQFATVERQHVGAVDKEAARIGLVERADDLEQRGFARAAGAYDTDNFAFLDVEVDALEHLEWAEGFPDSVEFYHNGVKVNGKRRKKQERGPFIASSSRGLGRKVLQMSVSNGLYRFLLKGSYLQEGVGRFFSGRRPIPFQGKSGVEACSNLNGCNSA